MTYDSFNNCDLLIVGIVLCVLLALIITMLAKVLCQGKRTESPKEKKEEKDTIDNVFEAKKLAKGISFQELEKRQEDISAYKTMFLVNAEITSRTGKMVSIRKTYHERIMKIAQVIGNNEITMFSYIDNVLKHHFDNYRDEITELYGKNFKDLIT